MTTLLQRLARRVASPEARDIDHSTFNLALVEEGGITAAGKRVDTDQALRLAAVYASIGLNADTLASMPIHAMEKAGPARQAVDPQPAWMDPSRGQPNPETDLFDFVHRIWTSRYTDGNAYALITARDRLRLPAEFWNLSPDEIQVSKRKGKLVYEWSDGTKFSRFSAATPNGEIIHIKGFNAGGLKGLSPIRKEAVGLGLAQDEYAARFFSNGAHADGIIEFPGSPNPTQLKQIRDEWARQHEGTGKSRRTGMLTGGATWKQTSIPNDDAQFLESRRFTLGEIARMFRVPPHLIGDVERSTSWGSGLEEQNRMWLIVGLLPEITRFERAFSPTLPAGQFIRVNPSGLLRADIKTRFEAYNQARQGGWMTGDEIRTLEDLNPAGLEDYWMPLAVDAADARETASAASAARILIQSGFDPTDVAKFLGLDLQHTGTVPVTVYPESEPKP